ncbi:MAG: ferredoxin oxidoreductase [Desulfobulbaceae bacterium]|nr:MAG: ferredoxin oxidoreductase [Desulfobulbaceae bacterium]
MSKKTLSIRMSGLGGQGAVTAAHIIGSAAVIDGKNATVNPFFGAEKRLAPAESYVRISDEVIYDTGEILYPDIIMVFHPDVILSGKSYTMPFFAGLQQNGTIIVNSDFPFAFTEDEQAELDALNAKVYFLQATLLAREIGGTDLATNIAMIGALVGVTKVVSMDAVEEALKERFGGAAKFVASATTAVLDDAIKAKYAKAEKLIEANMKVLTAVSAQAESLVAA